MRKLITILLVAGMCRGQSARSFATGSNGVALAASATTNNQSVGTAWALILTTDNTAANQRILDKNGTQRFLFVLKDSTNGDLRFGYNRSTVNLNILTPTAFVASGTCTLVAASWDASKTNADQHLYKGTLTTQVTESGSYSAQAVGSGTHDESAVGLGIGNTNPGGTGFFKGTVTHVGMVGSQLTVGQLNVILAGYFFPFAPLKLVLFPGINGTGTIPDWSGNGNTGTITGTSAAAACRGPLFGH